MFLLGLRFQTGGAVLQVDRWLISRANFLEQAYTLMSHHAKRKTALQVEFEGPLESGIGSGVHVSFFTDAAALLESFAENVTLTAQSGVPMWIVDSEARGGDGGDSEQLLCELFPHSLLGASAAAADAVCRRFQLLGWLFAKALMDQQLDERLLPLRLSPLFLDLALGRLVLHPLPTAGEAEGEGGVAAVANLEELPFLQLASALIKGGSQVKTLHKLWLQFEDGELSEAEVDATLDDYDVPFVDPATGGIQLPDGSLSPEVRIRCPLASLCPALADPTCRGTRFRCAMTARIGCCGPPPCANTSLASPIRASRHPHPDRCNGHPPMDHLWMNAWGPSAQVVWGRGAASGQSLHRRRPPGPSGALPSSHHETREPRS